MTDEANLPFSYGETPATPTGAKPRKHRHEYDQWHHEPPLAIIGEHVATPMCRCGAIQDPAASRRGRLNRSRGNSIERWVNGLLGIANRGKYGGTDDGGDSTDWIVVQTKSGGAYPERIDALLRAIPHHAEQLTGVVHTDTPGAGAKRRALITLDLYDFADWYGKR